MFSLLLDLVGCKKTQHHVYLVFVCDSQHFRGSITVLGCVVFLLCTPGVLWTPNRLRLWPRFQNSQVNRTCVQTPVKRGERPIRWQAGIQKVPSDEAPWISGAHVTLSLAVSGLNP